MRIENIKSSLITPQKTQLKQEENTINNKTIQNSITYKPVYYKDFNITFGTRLFRTPANFFEQEFNRKGMPNTMREYLYSDYEDRQNMPPNQMLKLVFDDLNQVKDLEQVKRIFPDEPLFNNLRSIPNKKSRVGVLAEIDMMKEPDKSLFKNGKNDLGLYILKKIYLEGKTLKEINNDFKKDISVHYKGISPIEYSTLAAYGIKYPNAGFWKSFIATREDFPYEYKPRKIETSRIHQKINPIQHKNEKGNIPQKKKFQDIKDWEIEKLSASVIDSNGNINEIKKHFKKRGVRDEASMGFVAKYMSEISSVVLEKVHASDEMKDFYQNYDKLTSKEKNAFDAYWNSDPFIRKDRSQAMKDTIKLFMDTYGVDGNNEDFQELLEYARSIKPTRINRQKEHDRIQTEYDEMFATLPFVQEETIEKENMKVENKVLTEKEMLEQAEKIAIKNGAKIFNYISPNGESYHFIANINERFEQRLREEMNLMPSKFTNKYVNYMLKSGLATEHYKESIAIRNEVPEFVQERLMSPEDHREISSVINHQFSQENPRHVVAAQQAFAERIIEKIGDKHHWLIILDPASLSDFATDTLNITEWAPEDKAKLNRDYDEYMLPITNKKDWHKINDILMTYISNLDLNSKFIDSPHDKLMDEIVILLSANIKKYPEAKTKLSKLLKESKFLNVYGGSAKILLKSDIPQSVKNEKCKLMFDDLTITEMETITEILALDMNNIDRYIKAENQVKELLLTKAITMEIEKNFRRNL